METLDIYVIIIVGGTIALLISGFMITILFVYEKRRHQIILETLGQEYEQELLKSRVEIRERTIQHIGAELHDNIGQIMSVVHLLLGVAQPQIPENGREDFDYARAITRRTMMDLRDVIMSLNTNYVGSTGFRNALEKELQLLSKKHDFKSDFLLTGIEYDLAPQKAIILFRICQEALGNIIKEACAQNIRILLDYNHPMSLQITGDGCIADTTQEEDDSPRPGYSIIKNMSYRAKLIQASVSVNSSRARGTAISITLPS